MHDVAGVDQARSHAAVHRRGDAGEAQLHLGELHLCGVGLHGRFELVHQRLLRVDLLLRGGVLRDQRGVALEVGARVDELGLVLGFCRLRLCELGLQRARVELREQLAGLDVLPFDKADLVELPVDARLDRDRGHGGNRRLLDSVV